MNDKPLQPHIKKLSTISLLRVLQSEAKDLSLNSPSQKLFTIKGTSVYKALKDPQVNYV